MLKKLTDTRNTKIISVILVIISALSSLLGILRESQISYLFGMSAETDIFYIGAIIPDLISNMIANICLNVYMRQYEMSSDKKDFTVSVLAMFLICATAIIIAAWAVFPFLAHLMAPGLNGEQLQDLVHISRIMIVSIFFSVLCFVATVTMNINGKFYLTGITSLIQNTSLIVLTFFFYEKFGFYGLAWSYLGANAIRALLILPAGWKDMKGRIKLKKSYRVMRHLPQISLNEIVLNMQIFVERSLASTFNGGTVTALYYAGKINALPNNMLINSVITVMYPKIIKETKDNQGEAASRTIISTLRIILFCLAFCGCYLIIFRQPVTSLLFEYGKFNAEDSRTVASLFVFYAPAVLLNGAAQLFMKVAYAIGKVTSVLVAMILSSVAYIVFAYALKLIWGAEGVAAGYVVYNFVMAVSLVMVIRSLGRNIRLQLKPSQCMGPVIVIVGILAGFSWIHVEGFLSLIVYSLIYVAAFPVLVAIADREVRMIVWRFMAKVVNRHARETKEKERGRDVATR
ncbi:murein biosynthesis integral membrane protein MurJ [Paenibacillus sp. UNC496MF]|uniref:lipid II flippase MurJ n=1 Tax=Paenibacillus sp. UNC496MF TaxID=1502753 RepID=UPI0008EA607D|nr:lipid II flippase MurJ [Paenibacillus sp. UNC496MF]SFI88166.1 murein biosynthesis integral membrane protein MurJ [Paenibacillus sp. UNC496MF]